MKRNIQNKGVTLIALVVTLIILLILAAVSMNMVLGDEGILTKAGDTANLIYETELNTQKSFNSLTEEMEKVINKNNDIDEEIDFTGKNFIWLGDSLVRGLNETANYAFPEHFAEQTHATCYNFSALGAKIDEDSSNNLKKQVNEAVSAKNNNLDVNVDFIMISIGGNDIFDYTSRNKEIGKVDTKTTEVSARRYSDFRF